MRLLNGKQGLRRSHFAIEIRGTDLEKVLIVPIAVSKVLQKAMINNYYGESTESTFSFMVSQTGMKFLIDKIERAKSSLINPASTHEERKQHLTFTKTDDIDLYLIAEALIGNKATNSKLSKDLINNFNALLGLEEVRLRKDHV